MALQWNIKIMSFIYLEIRVIEYTFEEVQRLQIGALFGRTSSKTEDCVHFIRSLTQTQLRSIR